MNELKRGTERKKERKKERKNGINACVGYVCKYTSYINKDTVSNVAAIYLRRM